MEDKRVMRVQAKCADPSDSHGASPSVRNGDDSQQFRAKPHSPELLHLVPRCQFYPSSIAEEVRQLNEASHRRNHGGVGSHYAARDVDVERRSVHGKGFYERLMAIGIVLRYALARRSAMQPYTVVWSGEIEKRLHDQRIRPAPPVSDEYHRRAPRRNSRAPRPEDPWLRLAFRAFWRPRTRKRVH